MKKIIIEETEEEHGRVTWEDGSCGIYETFVIAKEAVGRDAK